MRLSLATSTVDIDRTEAERQITSDQK